MNANTSKFVNILLNSEIERQVEDAYNGMLETAFPGISVSYPYACDGYFETKAGGKDLKCICEFKYDLNLTSKTERSKVLAQVLFYLKRFENDGRPLPNVIFVGDRNECFCLHANDLVKHLDFEGVDWSKAPSSAGECSELVVALATDEERNAFVWKVDSGFDFGAVKAQMESFAAGVARMIHVTEHNVDRVFGMFRDRILKDAKKIQPNDLVGLFYGCVCDPESNYLHPAKKNALVAGGREYRVDASAFRAFRQVFEYVKSPSQKKHLAAISDRLIEDTNRRRKGEFYTPTPFVDEAHRRISSAFGEDWKDEYVVVDCCCGTKNLTRDYRFKELYCSTLEQAELDISKNYNPEAVSFRFDFLNESLEDLERKAPGLVKAFRENRKILWFINPPYFKANDKDSMGSGISAINTLMNAEKYGKCSANLYAQFLYRIMSIKRQFGLTDCNLAFFCNPNYLTGRDLVKFRQNFLDEFDFANGMLFNAGHFSDVSANWGINFSIWKSGKCKDKNNFNHDLVDFNGEDLTIIGNKVLYNLDFVEAMPEWVRSGTVGIKKSKALPLTNAISAKTAGKVYMELLAENAVGFFYSKANDLQHSGQESSLFSSVLASGMGGGINIIPDNFARCCAAFAARRLIACDWQNNQDQYLKPNMDDPCYAEFESDALVYSLFESKSQQSSLRKVEYKGKACDVKNEFFWIPAEKMAEWADQEGLDETYAEASASPDRHMAKVLVGTALSPEAKAVLDKATELTEKSMKFRKLFDEDHPEYQCLNWDASYYQLKPIWKTYMKTEFEEFRSLVKALADRMRPMVYELGFLRK